MQDAASMAARRGEQKEMLGRDQGQTSARARTDALFHLQHCDTGAPLTLIAHNDVATPPLNWFQIACVFTVHHKILHRHYWGSRGGFRQLC